MFPIFRDVTRLDLAVDRRVRGAGPGGDLGQAEFEIGIAEQEREDLALLLGAQDGQERKLYLAAADDGCGRGSSRPL